MNPWTHKTDPHIVRTDDGRILTLYSSPSSLRRTLNGTEPVNKKQTLDKEMLLAYLDTKECEYCIVWPFIELAPTYRFVTVLHDDDCPNCRDDNGIPRRPKTTRPTLHG